MWASRLYHGDLSHETKGSPTGLSWIIPPPSSLEMVWGHVLKLPRSPLIYLGKLRVTLIISSKKCLWDWIRRSFDFWKTSFSHSWAFTRACFPDGQSLHFGIVCIVEGMGRFKTDESYSFLTFLLSISLIHLELYNKQQEEARLHLQCSARRYPPLERQGHSLLVLLFTQKSLLWETGSTELCATTQQGSPSLLFPGTGSSFPSETSLAASAASVFLPTVRLWWLMLLLHHVSQSFMSPRWGSETPLSLGMGYHILQNSSRLWPLQIPKPLQF